MNWSSTFKPNRLSAALRWNDHPDDPEALSGPALASLARLDDSGGCALTGEVEVPPGHTGLMLVFSGSGYHSVYDAYAAYFCDLVVSMPPHAIIRLPDGTVGARTTNWSALKARFD